VELVALAWPGLRRLRNGPADDRSRLARAAWILGAALALFQGWGIATYLQAIRGLDGSPVAEPGPGTRAVLALTIAAGAVGAGGLAEWISRRGLGNGFAVLLALAPIEAVALRAGRLPGTGVEIAGLHVALVLVVAAGVVFWRRVRRRGGRVHPPVPTCGLVPIHWTAALLSAPRLLATFLPASPGLSEVAGEVWPYLWGAITLLLAWSCSRLFCAPAAVLGAYRRAAPVPLDGEATGAVEKALRRAHAWSLLLVVGPVIAGVPLDTLLGLPLVVAVALDLTAEAKARARGPLVSARPLHRVYAVEPALQALASVGIEAFPRASRFRRLFHFFAPFAPIEILVPPERAFEAEAICARVAGDEAERPAPI
jgi:hypothetical protein